MRHSILSLLSGGIAITRWQPQKEQKQRRWFIRMGSARRKLWNNKITDNERWENFNHWILICCRRDSHEIQHKIQKFFYALQTVLRSWVIPEGDLSKDLQQRRATSSANAPRHRLQLFMNYFRPPSSPWLFSIIIPFVEHKSIQSWHPSRTFPCYRAEIFMQKLFFFFSHRLLRIFIS